MTAGQERKRNERQHPSLDAKAAPGFGPHLQVQFLARRLRGDPDDCPPWFWN